jgi:AAHS family 4-hydroxybenzoate transporter-like MFS transporter
MPQFDVGRFIAGQRLGAFQIRVLLLCALIMVADGYDVFVMGFVLPAVSHDFGVSPAAIAPVFVAQAIGLAIGNYLISPIADRVGRRTMLLASAGLFGLITLATTQVTSVNELIGMRFLAGMFFASLVPNAIALTTEIAPHRLRATMVTWMFIGYTGGAAAGGGVAAFLVQSYGWQAAFWVGGLAPLLILPFLAWLLPESLRYCVQRNPADPRIPALLRRIDPALRLTGRERFTLNEPVSTGVPVVALFRDNRAAGTLLLWLGYFMNLMVITIMGAFLPTLLRTLGGLSLQSAAGITSFYSISGIIAMLVFGRLLDRYGTSRILMITYVLAAVALAVLGMIDMTSIWLYPVVFCVGACVIAAQGGLNALGAVLYPTRMRATGVGWAFGAGRMGSMVGPFVGGAMLAGHWPAVQAFGAIAVPMLIAAAGMFCIGFTAPPIEDEPVEGETPAGATA